MSETSRSISSSLKELEVDNLENVISEEDLNEIEKSQKMTAIRFEKTNEMLNNCNLIVANHLSLLGDKLVDHTKLIRTLKGDLDIVYDRIRKLKAHLHVKYPAEVEKAEQDELEKMPLPIDD